MDENIQLRLVKNESNIEQLTQVVNTLAVSVSNTNRSIDSLSKQQADSHTEVLRMLSSLELKQVQSKVLSLPVLFTCIGVLLAVLGSVSSALVLFVNMSLAPVERDMFDNKNNIEIINKDINIIKKDIYTHTHK